MAAKISLSTRLDALCDESIGNEEGIRQRAYLEGIVNSEQERPVKKFSGTKKNSLDVYTHKKFVIFIKYKYIFSKRILNLNFSC